MPGYLRPGFALLLFLPIAAQADPLPEKQQEVLRALEKDIAAVRGLAFKQPVAAERVRQPKSPSVTYDVAARKLLLPAEPAACDRGELIHGLVHALLDQHFDLAKLRQKAAGADAELALAALIEGDATWTRITLRQKEDPKAAAILDAPLEKAAELRQAFLTLQGGRYVRVLHQRGGWKRVDSAYRFPPRSTAGILHPDGGSSIDLGPGPVRGAFALVEMLAGQPATAAAAMPATSGWLGDRFQEDSGRKSWVIAFATEADARRCLDTLVRWQTAHQPGLRPLTTGPDGRTWADGDRAILGMQVQGDRVFVLAAPDEPAYRALRETVEGPPALVVHAAGQKRPLPFGALIDRLLEADLVCIGETHDSDLHHRVQHQIIKGLFARDERLGVGLEMFQRPYQDALDRYGRGEIGDDELLKAAEYRQRWGYAWSLYRPIADFCRRNRVPLAALNAPRELTSRISSVGFDALTAEEKQQLEPIDYQVPKHRAYWYDRLAAMHGQKDAPAEQKERSYQVMTTWDGFMAASAARFQKERQLRRLVVLAGSGHIERRFGIPERASKETGGKALTVAIQVGGDPDAFHREPLTDFLVIVK
jgi:uncharacterized iron-regulated protein